MRFLEPPSTQLARNRLSRTGANQNIEAIDFRQSSVDQKFMPAMRRMEAANHQSPDHSAPGGASAVASLAAEDLFQPV
jgi:hypothetical protein